MYIIYMPIYDDAYAKQQRIIEPITSRCAKFRFKSLPIDDLTKRIDYICELEKVQLASGVSVFARLNSPAPR